MSKIAIYTELTYKLDKYMEVQHRIAVAAQLALQTSEKIDTFLSGVYLRMIVDAAANLFWVNCMSNSLKDKFVNWWMAGKPINKFKVKVNGKWEYLSTGYIQRNNEIFDRLYKALNPMVHPSKEYLERIYKEDDKTAYLDRDVPSGKVDDMGAISLFNFELDRLSKWMSEVVPTSEEYRELTYTDSEMELKGEEPMIMRIYKE